MTHSLVSLLYVSKVNIELNAERLAELERRAATFNAEQGVTGLLVFNGANFVQLIEGDAPAINRVMERIERDDMHSNIHILRNSPMRERECPEWGMRCHFFQFVEEGAAEKFANTLPSSMLPDTRLIFTSLASAVGLDIPER